MLYSLDRFEGDVAVLVDEEGNSRCVRRSTLPDDVRAGDMLREQDGNFVTDSATTDARCTRILQLQNSLRRRK